METHGAARRRIVALLSACLALVAISSASGNGNVYVSRFWHNHQPIYWPEWNNGSQTERIQYAWDSIWLKENADQTYGTGVQHPDNNLRDIFGLDDRRAAYQERPRDSLSNIGQAGGFAISYSGSLINNVDSLGGNGQLGYSSTWYDGNRQASGWYTPSGSRRLDLVGFTYHHSLGPLLPKEVFRKELQVFKQAWWKAWDKNGDLSDHSKGFFPTEMAFSPTMIDVLADEGYEWAIVASHHLSRTCPTYFNYANPSGTYNIYSSPPNQADLLGPSPSSGWWYSEPNPGNAAWNVSPHAYQLHKIKYVNPSNGAEKTIIVVPSDDVLSYRFGYANEGIGKIQTYISPFATDPSRPVIVMPSSDGDNAWGGGYSSWMEATPQYFGDSAGAGYNISTPQDFVNAHGAAAPVAHIEDGAWIFPEMDYGSPYFLKWVEPPLNATNIPACYPGTTADLETPGFALKFWSWAPVIAGANWCETAEQMLTDADGSVQAWKIQDPYNNLGDGNYVSPNYAERAWHVYLGGLDSGFNYYGGLGNDDEVKQTLATRRAVELLQAHVVTNLAHDRTPPTVFRPQRFPWNPGAYTFGWFNSQPGGGTNSAYLKKMPSEFYVWTHAYDISGITGIALKVRFDSDGVNTLANNHNETYDGGSDVGSWTSIAMTKRELPKTRTALNAAANNSQIDYFIEPHTNGVADYYFAKITDASAPGFRGKLLDYYIEAFDARTNRHRSDIQHVFVENDGQGGSLPSAVAFSDDPRDCADLTVTYIANGGVLSNLLPVVMYLRFTNSGDFGSYMMSHQGGGTSTYTVAQVSIPDNAPLAEVYFQNGSTIDNNSGLNWSTSIRDCDAPTGTSSVVFSNAPACDPVTLVYFLNSGPLAGATQVLAHIGYGGWSQVFPTQAMAKAGNNQWNWTGTPPQGYSQIDAVFHNGAGTWDNNGGQDWHFTINVCEPPVVPPGITITNPPSDTTLGNEVTQYTLQGQAGEGVMGLMRWTNSLTGGNGQLSAVNPWSIVNVPLAVGDNVITITGTNSGSSVVTNAADSGASSVYDDGWATNDNGGFGFGDWLFYTSSGDGNQNGLFMGTSSAIDIGTPAWGLYANSGQFSEAKRLLTNTLAAGQTFAIKLDHGYLDPGASAGIALLNNAGETLWQFYFHGGMTNYDITGSTSDIQWTPGGLDIEVTLASATTYVSRITPLGSTTRTNAGALDITNDMAITAFRAWNWNAGPGSDHDVFFNAPKIMTAGGGSGSTTSDTVTITRQAGWTDTDGDGMPDSWEEKHFDGATNANASSDADSDGASNWEEFVADTNPTNGASVFTNRLDYVEGVDVLEITVPAPTTNSRVYDLWVSTNLVGGDWTPRNLRIPGANNGAPISLMATNVGELGYYRSGVTLP
ncbi:MAG: hypothetical protein JXB04_03580 [Kiritimatiellae bacterium]|nr:hypothetical protein [Kiritimatiellia bacterium]